MAFLETSFIQFLISCFNVIIYMKNKNLFGVVAVFIAIVILSGCIDSPTTSGTTSITNIKGDENAPVTIIEYSDFECPFCARFYSDTLGQIEKEYIETGKANLEFKHFPLGFHSNAQKAAEATECAEEQGKFWEMHDKLFEDGVSGGVSTFKKYAKDLGLNTVKFDECIDSGRTADSVKADIKEGKSNGVTGTPAFLINGKLVSGAQPFSVFKQAIEAEL
jgi:protein-disulfide isomerase